MPGLHHVQGWPSGILSTLGRELVDSDYWGEIKVILFNHSAEDFAVQAGDRIAQLILERIETPQVKKVAALDDTDRGAGGFGSTGTNQLIQSSQEKDKKGTKKKNLLSPSLGSRPRQTQNSVNVVVSATSWMARRSTDGQEVVWGAAGDTRVLSRSTPSSSNPLLPAQLLKVEACSRCSLGIVLNAQQQTTQVTGYRSRVRETEHQRTARA